MKQTRKGTEHINKSGSLLNVFTLKLFTLKTDPRQWGQSVQVSTAVQGDRPEAQVLAPHVTISDSQGGGCTQLLAPGHLLQQNHPK